jgi:hypothetical protein
MKAITVAAIVVVLAIVGFFAWRFGPCGSGRCRVTPSEYDSKMLALARTDQNLIRYHEVGAIPLGLREPTGIAVDKAGRIYAAGDYAIRVFRANGAHELDFRTADRPYCVAVSDDGMIYAGMRDHVEVFGRNGARVAAWSSAGGRAYFTSIAVLGGNLWAADSGNRVVLRYSLSGKLATTIGAKDPARNAPGLVAPSPYIDVAPLSSGAIWVSDPGRHQVELYAPDGQMKRSWGTASFAIDGFSGCCNPTGIALLPGGRFVTSEKGLPRVKVYGADGTFQCVVAGRESFAPDVAGLDLATDARGRVYVLDPSARSVRVFAEKSKRI